MPFRVTARGDGDGDSRQQYAHERRESEKLVGAIERGAQLRARVTHTLDALPELQPRRQPRAKLFDGLRRAGKQQTMLDAAAPLHEPGGRHIGEVHEQTRRDAEQIAAAIRLIAQDPRHEQPRRAELQLIAHIDAENAEEARVQPRTARRGDPGRRLVLGEGRIGDPQRTAQRIGFVDRLELLTRVAAVVAVRVVLHRQLPERLFYVFRRGILRDT